MPITHSPTGFDDIGQFILLNRRDNSLIDIDYRMVHTSPRVLLFPSRRAQASN